MKGHGDNCARPKAGGFANCRPSMMFVLLFLILHRFFHTSLESLIFIYMHNTERYTCDTTDAFDMVGFTEIESLKTSYQELDFSARQDTDDLCMSLVRRNGTLAGADRLAHSFVAPCPSIVLLCFFLYSRVSRYISVVQSSAHTVPTLPFSAIQYRRTISFKSAPITARITMSTLLMQLGGLWRMSRGLPLLEEVTPCSYMRHSNIPTFKRLWGWNWIKPLFAKAFSISIPVPTLRTTGSSGTSRRFVLNQ